MPKRAPRPCLHGQYRDGEWTLTLYEAAQGSLKRVARWKEPHTSTFQSSGNIVTKLEAIRAERKLQGK